MIDEELFERLSPKGKRRAVIVDCISGVFYTVFFTACGILLCAAVYGLQVMFGVAN